MRDIITGDYIESGLLDGVVTVLVDNALCFLLESLYDARRPPLLEVTELVVLPTYRQWTVVTCLHTSTTVAADNTDHCTD